MDSLPELEAKIKQLLEQYKQIELALTVAPGNAELLNARNELQEVITLTEDLYNLKKAELATKVPPTPPPPQPPLPTSPSSTKLRFQVGAQIEAVFSEDKLWYPAVVDAITERGTYMVTFLGYGNSQEVPPEEAREVKQSKKRAAEKQADEDKPFTIPKNLIILPTDSEDVRAKKKRKLKSLKSKHRLKEIEKVKEEKKQNWKDFTTKKGKRKVGFLTGMRKESIFKSPDSVSGKVGVTGSGAGMTPNPEDMRTKFKKKPGVLLPPFAAGQ